MIVAWCVAVACAPLGGCAEGGLDPDAGAAGGRDGGGANADGSSAEGQSCARADLALTRSIPTVWLLVDGSGTMSEAFPGQATAPRWNVLREALLNNSDGLISRLQGSVAFGLMVYDGGLSIPGVHIDGVCPRVTVVSPATGNLSAIASAYPNQPLGSSTPTHYALQELKARIDAAGQSPQGPTYIVLATDGKPNLCDFHDGVPSSDATEREAVNSVRSLASAGTQLFAISMAGGDAALQAHLEDVAMAGDTGQPAFTPTSREDLVRVLSETVGAAVSCAVQLEGRVVEGQECAGEVSLNGRPLVCNDPNGYRVREDHRSLEFVGEACDELLGEASSQVEARFTCNDVIII